jgi:archaellum component FlaC
MSREIEDSSKALGGLREEFDDVEMRVTDVKMLVKAAHFAIALMKEDVRELKTEVRDLNDIVANFSNQLESVHVEDVAWCRLRITSLEKPNNPANRSLWQLVNTLSARLDRQEDKISDLKTGLARAHEKICSLEMLSALV